MTRGSSRTSPRRSLGDHRAGFEAVDAIGDPHDERHVVLDHEHRRAELALDAHDQRAERFGLALRDAAGRFVEQEDARVDREQRAQLDDPAGPGGEVRHELVGVAAEAEEVDRARRLRRACAARRRATAADPVIDGSSHERSRASSATMIVSRTVSAGYRRAAWKPRPRPARWRRYAAGR